MAANGNETGKADDPLGRAADRIREAAKWLIVSFAAVGVTLYGGLQLASIGKLSTDEPSRLVVAGIGVLLGLLGLAAAMAAASSVVTKSYASLRWLEGLNKDDPIRTDVEGDRSLLGGYASVAALRQHLDQAQKRRRRAYQNRYAPAPASETEAQRDARVDATNTEFSYADNWAQSLKQIEANVLQVASFNRVAGAYGRARKRIFMGAGLAALGIALFAWGANPPEHIAAEQVLPPTPSDVTVVVPRAMRAANRADLGNRSLQRLLGKNCDLSTVKAVAVGAKGASYEVVSVRTDKCNAAFFTISPAQGRLVPRES